MIYGDTIRLTRQGLQLKQSEVAVIAGCTQSMISKVENGALPPSMDLLSKIAAAVGLKFRIILE